MYVPSTLKEVFPNSLKLFEVVIKHFQIRITCSKKFELIRLRFRLSNPQLKTTSVTFVHQLITMSNRFNVCIFDRKRRLKSFRLCFLLLVWTHYFKQRLELGCQLSSEDLTPLSHPQFPSFWLVVTVTLQTLKWFVPENSFLWL